VLYGDPLVPEGSDAVVITTAELTARVKVACATLCGAMLSVTCTVTVSVSTTVCVPERIPVTGSIENLPPVLGVMTALHVIGYVPPVSVSWKL